jgi:threonine aldolase
MFCLSKGLAAPVGSLLVGETDLIAEARRVRKMLGGGMRQVGVLAAAGLVALRDMDDRLPEDHERARRLALGLAELPAVELDPSRVRTNILIFRLRPERVPGPATVPAAERLVEGLRARGVLAGAFGADAVRLVTHYEIGDAEVAAALAAARAVLA